MRDDSHALGGGFNMMAELTAAFTSLKVASEIAQSLVGLHDKCAAEIEMKDRPPMDMSRAFV